MLCHFRTFCNQCTIQNAYVRTHWGFPTPTILSLVFTIPFKLGSSLFFCLSLPLVFLQPIRYGCWLDGSCTFQNISFHIVVGSPIPILAISVNPVFWFLDSPGFNMVKSLNKNIFGVSYLSFGAGLCSVTSSLLKCWNERSFFFSDLDKWLVIAINLSSLGSVLVHSFAGTVLFYL